MTTKPTPAQQRIIDRMQQGHVLFSELETKYRPFDMPLEFGGYLHHPHTDSQSKIILISTIKAMLSKGLIVERNRYIWMQGTWDGHETETWRINYKLNLCAHCYEAPIADNGLYCQSCADQIGKEYMDEWSQRVNSAGQQEALAKAVKQVEQTQSASLYAAGIAYFLQDMGFDFEEISEYLASQQEALDTREVRS